MVGRQVLRTLPSQPPSGAAQKVVGQVMKEFKERQGAVAVSVKLAAEEGR